MTLALALLGLCRRCADHAGRAGRRALPPRWSARCSSVPRGARDHGPGAPARQPPPRRALPALHRSRGRDAHDPRCGPRRVRRRLPRRGASPPWALARAPGRAHRGLDRACAPLALVRRPARCARACGLRHRRDDRYRRAARASSSRRCSLSSGLRGAAFVGTLSTIALRDASRACRRVRLERPLHARALLADRRRRARDHRRQRARGAPEGATVGSRSRRASSTGSSWCASASPARPGLTAR